MSEHAAPTLHKRPFFIGDALLVAVAVWLVFRPGPPLNLPHHALVAACVALAGWLGVLPFLLEYRAALRFAEADRLATTVDQIKRLEAVADQIATATGRWQTVQEAADKTARTATEITDRITTEARNFTEFMQKANDAQVRHLQLEVEKLHRAEGEFLQVIVRMLDHVFALYSAAVRSAQPGLIEQLGHFQFACRDAARRVGLVPLEPQAGTPFDPKLHQLHEGQPPADGGVIAQVLATGYSYQGQMLRPALVTLATPTVATPAESQPARRGGAGLEGAS